MQVFLKKYQNLILLLLWGLWAALAVQGLPLRIPYIDESHAYNIAANTNLLDWILLPKYEGHFFSWFFVLKLTKWLVPLPYPWDMFVVNFILMSVFVWWVLKKSPLAWFVKLLLIFSYPICFFYSVYARCYSVFLLLLLLTCNAYPRRVERPVVFFICLFFLAHTCIFGTIAAVAFGLIWALDLWLAYRKKQVPARTLWLCAGLSVLTGILLWIETHPHYVPVYNIRPVFKQALPQFSKLQWSQISGYILFGLLLVKNWRVCFWYAATMLSIVLIHYNMYRLTYWHFTLFYVFAIFSLWIYDCKKYKKTAILLVGLLAVFFYQDLRYDEPFFYRFKYDWDKTLVADNKETLKNATVFVGTLHTSGTVPFLNLLGIKPISMETGMEMYSMENLKWFHRKHAIWDIKIDYGKIKDKIDFSKPTLLIAKRYEVLRLVYWDYDDRRFAFEEIDCAPGGREIMQPCIFKVIPDPNDTQQVVQEDEED